MTFTTFMRLRGRGRDTGHLHVTGQKNSRQKAQKCMVVAKRLKCICKCLSLNERKSSFLDTRSAFGFASAVRCPVTASSAAWTELSDPSYLHLAAGSTDALPSWSYRPGFFARIPVWYLRPPTLRRVLPANYWQSRRPTYNAVTHLTSTLYLQCLTPLAVPSSVIADLQLLRLSLGRHPSLSEEYVRVYR